MPRKKKEETVTVEVTLKMNTLLRDGVSIYQLLDKETEFLAEPQSINGCVTSIDLIGFKKI